jgi:ssDNA-binding Zn-finger/Zn-ribbon topoisomerase 1
VAQLFSFAEVDMNYNEKLKTPEWREFRERILEIKGYTCENCGENTDSPQIHHAGYVPGREPWQYAPEEVRVLCDQCHGIIHERRQEFRQLFTRLTWKNTQVLLRALLEFRTALSRNPVLAHRVYGFLRDEKYRIQEENELLRLEERREGIRYDVENVLLSFPEGVLDPLLDGLDHLNELTEVDKNQALNSLRTFVKEQPMANSDCDEGPE